MGCGAAVFGSLIATMPLIVGRGVPLPRWAAAVVAVCLAGLAGYYFWLIWQPRERRPGWSRSSIEHMSAFACGAVGVSIGSMALGIAGHAAGYNPRIDVPLLALPFVLAALGYLHDAWAESDYRIW